MYFMYTLGKMQNWIASTLVLKMNKVL